MLKAVILIGGPQKGTRFRPLSFEVPKPLFPVAGVPMLQHHIEACVKVPNLKEILLIGFYQPNEELNRFLFSAQQEFKMSIRYLQEFAALGTGGGIYHFRDQILSGSPEAFFVLNADVCSAFPLTEMLNFQKEHGEPNSFVILGTTANRKQSLNYGCIVENEDTNEVLHYVEKPSTFVSDIINCGIYLFNPEIFQHIGAVFQKNQQDMLLEEPTNGWHRAEAIRLEQDIFTALAGQGRLYVYKTLSFWSQIKSAGSAIYASRLYLNQYHTTHPERLASNKEGAPKITGNVYIHPTANIDPTAVLGPNVSIGTGVTIGAGVRVRESIILHGANLQDQCCVLNSIVGWDSTIGKWARVEGTPSDPNPNDPFAKMDSETLFRDGKLTPSITILEWCFHQNGVRGCNVTIPSEVIILNSIVLPHKDLNHSFKNQIIL
ncbi:mannose-1-phosphate guanyltransferase alpha-A isoform X2 [Girardinichthys multiradiatus]|uniref:mannose-1-phosphate guanyltransferase alpha-A isoform X2 n=1 Tax=Girardinichthys multiradiatus TaxID=208333 RepID=UPI001FABFE53|nr:mannose-1-phosphate guanyltransferase alpha-A isoform X2 [Girardinichthys multiradiatus]